MIDIHFHLDFFEKKNELIEESKESLRGIVNCALSLREAEESLGLKKKYLNFFFFTLGFHPQEEDKFSEKIFKQYEVFIKKNKKEILAIGEIGLDYADEKKDQKKMKKIFSLFLDLAKEQGLPVLIHCRQAFDDLMEILREKKMERVILHCFSGSEGVLKEALRRGYFISFATNICYTQKHPRLARIVPLERIFLETDAPWLDPFSQGKVFQNKPLNILESAKFISQIKSLSVKEVLEKVEENFNNFFERR